jgi:hypothetical protein
MVEIDRSGKGLYCAYCVNQGTYDDQSRIKFSNQDAIEATEDAFAVIGVLLQRG